MPGAAPTGFCQTSEPRGTSAMVSTDAGSFRAARLPRSRMCASTLSSSCNGRLSAVATAFRVMSSGVGPSPPVMITPSARESASFKASPIPSAVSPTVL